MTESDGESPVVLEPSDSGSAGTQREPSSPSTALIKVQPKDAGALHAITTADQWRELAESDASSAVKREILQSFVVAQLEKSEADLRVRLRAAEDQIAELRTNLRVSEREAADLRTDLGVARERAKALRGQLGSRVFTSAISTLVIGFAGNFFGKSMALFWVFLLVGVAIFAGSWVPSLSSGGDR